MKTDEPIPELSMAGEPGTGSDGGRIWSKTRNKHVGTDKVLI